MAVLMIILYAVVSAAAIAILIKKKYIREIFVFLALMAVSLLYSISGVTDWYFYSPSSLVEFVFKPLSQVVFPGRGE